MSLRLAVLAWSSLVGPVPPDWAIRRPVAGWCGQGRVYDDRQFSPGTNVEPVSKPRVPPLRHDRCGRGVQVAVDGGVDILDQMDRLCLGFSGQGGTGDTDGADRCDDCAQEAILLLMRQEPGAPGKQNGETGEDNQLHPHHSNDGQAGCNAAEDRRRRSQPVQVCVGV